MQGRVIIAFHFLRGLKMHSNILVAFPGLRRARPRSGSTFSHLTLANVRCSI